jgi:DNA-binding transcriptional LysR family regulator
LAPLVAGFQQTYPKIVLDVEVATYREPPIEDFDITLIGADASFDANVIARRINVTEAILVAAPRYLAHRPAPQAVHDLLRHACLRMKPESLGRRPWTLFRSDRPEDTVELDVQPVLWANHTDTLLGATLGGAGISATPVEIAAPHLASGALVRVLSPWIAGRFTLYAALPSRKFMPQRSRVFLDYLGVETQRSVLSALAACAAC